MAYQHGVIARAVQLTVGLIDQLMALQHSAIDEGEWVIKLCDLWCDQANTVCRKGVGHYLEPEHQARGEAEGERQMPQADLHHIDADKHQYRRKIDASHIG